MAVINTLTPKLTDEYIRTDFEKLFEIGLKSLNVNYRTGVIYCFTCKKTFTWLRSELPQQCLRGLHKWTEPGQFARPDFLIYNTNNRDEDIDEQPIAIVRIDGPVHDTRKQKTKDKLQTESFLNIGIRVFIVRNEHLLGAQHSTNKKRKSTWHPVRFPDWIYEACAAHIWRCCHNDDMYKKYLNDKEVRHFLGIKV